MLETLIERIRAAHENRSPLIIQGGGSKTFYGSPDEGEVLSSRALTGVVDYQPKELVLTARAGTPLAEIEALLAEQGQMLAFEPPHFGGPATLGGSIAAGLSGPRRPYAGAARDFVLGVRMVDGTGQPLRFGGQVIKNVAGYDVSRLMVGALGTLGLLTEVSLKVLPLPATETSLQFELDEADAILKMNQWAGQPLPLSATSWHAGYDVSRLMVGALGTLGLLTEVSLKVLPQPATESSLQFELDEAEAILKMNQWAGQPLPLSATSWHAGLLTLRLSGATSAVQAAQARLGGEVLRDAAAFWQRLRDQTTPFFDRRPRSNQSLWRLAVKPTTPPLNLGEAQWIEWGGAVRWLASDRAPAALRDAAKAAGGHATLFRGQIPADGAFTPLAPAMASLHRNLKQRFDPRGIFNHGRMYPDW